MELVKLNQLKKGDYLIRAKGVASVVEATRARGDEPIIPEGIVWVKGDYDRSTKRYSVSKFTDSNRESLVKGDTLVLVGFTF